MPTYLQEEIIFNPLTPLQIFLSASDPSKIMSYVLCFAGIFLNNLCSVEHYGIFFYASYLLTRVPEGDDFVRGDGYYLKMK